MNGTKLLEYLRKGYRLFLTFWRYIPNLIQILIQTINDQDLQACQTRHRQAWRLLELSSTELIK